MKGLASIPVSHDTHPHTRLNEHRPNLLNPTCPRHLPPPPPPFFTATAGPDSPTAPPVPPSPLPPPPPLSPPPPVQPTPPTPCRSHSHFPQFFLYEYSFQPTNHLRAPPTYLTLHTPPLHPLLATCTPIERTQGQQHAMPCEPCRSSNVCWHSPPGVRHHPCYTIVPALPFRVREVKPPCTFIYYQPPHS